VRGVRANPGTTWERAYPATTPLHFDSSFRISSKNFWAASENLYAAKAAGASPITKRLVTIHFFISAFLQGRNAPARHGYGLCARMDRGDATEIRTVVDEVSPGASPMGLLDMVGVSMSIPGRIRRARPR
jgi:hypothetical protein